MSSLMRVFNFSFWVAAGGDTIRSHHSGQSRNVVMGASLSFVLIVGCWEDHSTHLSRIRQDDANYAGLSFKLLAACFGLGGGSVSPVASLMCFVSC